MKLLPSDKVFCNSPWYELHIYWDGALSFCCHATPEVPYPVAEKSKYNIRNMSIAEWYVSEPMQQARLRMLGSERWNHCRKCYHEEEHSNTSRRHRSNQKSVIFREQFQNSFEQSPGYDKFADLNYKGLPVDLHIDLGNYCNLACKMCTPEASSRIASQHRVWKMTDTVATDWTRDQATWDRFLAELITIPKLKNIHFMGGETLIQPRFEECIDYLIANKRTDVLISFVTNGTTYNPVLIKKLKQFARVGLEVSIETLGKTNNYIRQGTDTKVVVNNIMKYIAECNNTSITLTLRPAPSLLSARDYWQVIEFALQNQLLIKSNLCSEPEFLSIGTLPQSIRLTYLDNYKKLLQDLDNIDLAGEYNESDPGNYQTVAKKQILQMISLLSQPDPDDQYMLLTQLMQHIQDWDQVYGFDARALYPELEELLTRHSYAV
jgi:MoaA/NifB/PqqE/SkfB family radical SAM enzyme